MSLSADVLLADRLVVEHALDSLGKAVCYRELLNLWTTAVVRDTVGEYDFGH